MRTDDATRFSVICITIISKNKVFVYKFDPSTEGISSGASSVRRKIVVSGTSSLRHQVKMFCAAGSCCGHVCAVRLRPVRLAE